MNLSILAVLRNRLAGVALAGGLAHAATAQSPAQQRAIIRTHPPFQLIEVGQSSPVGTWRGTSACLVRPSACNDEIVVYRITAMKRADSLAVDARKIVRGEEQDMGVLGCSLVLKLNQFSCTIPQGVWYFRVRSDSLTGELRLPDDTRFREVRTIRAP